MRSHDYCHFEIVLGGSIEAPTEATNATAITAVDDLRKQAARLADKAVEQYKIKKAAIEASEGWELKGLAKQAHEIAKKPESEWTPDDKAIVKRHRDALYARYDYDDNWREED